MKKAVGDALSVAMINAGVKTAPCLSGVAALKERLKCTSYFAFVQCTFKMPEKKPRKKRPGH
jgi:hypothetical protein